MATYRHGKDARFAVGSYEVSSWYKDISVPRGIMVSDVTPFNTSDKIYVVGQADSQITAQGMWQSQISTTAIASQTPTYSLPNSTLTTSSAHGLSVGQPVLLSGFSTSGYNGYFITQTGTTGSTLVIITNASLGATGSAGTVTVSSNEIEDIMQGVMIQEGSSITVAPDKGFVVGNRCYLGFGKLTQHNVHSPVSDVTALNSSFQMNSGLHGGIILADGSSVSASTTSTGLNNGSQSTIGWTANLHIVANTRSTASTIKIQHSSDNSVWTDLVTFASIGLSTITSEYQEALSGTVNQYVRVNITLTVGTGSISPIISFSRS